MAKQDGYTRITLRIPTELHEHLAASAEKTSKSMNAEIIARLEDSYLYGDKSPAEKFTEDVATKAAAKAMEQAMETLSEKVRQALEARFEIAVNSPGFIKLMAEAGEHLPAAPGLGFKPKNRKPQDN